MNEILWAVAAIWGVSGAAVTVMFTLDERAHRRQSATPTPAPVAVPAVSGARAPRPSPSRQRAHAHA